MEWMITLLVLGLHLGWAFYLTHQFKQGRFQLPAYYLLFAYLLPGVGPLILMIIQLSQRIELEPLLVEEPMDTMVEETFQGIDRNPKLEQVLPLETALLLEDSRLARQLLLDLPLAQAKKNLGLLFLARQHRDSEIVHYAASLIASIQEEYEQQVRQLRQAYQADLQNQEKGRLYQEALKAYLATGLLEGAAKRAYLLQVRQLMEQNFSSKREYRDAIDLVTTNLELKNYQAVQEELYDLLINWSEQEEVWMLLLRYYYELHDAWNFRKVLASIREEGLYLNKENQEHVRFWEQRLERIPG